MLFVVTDITNAIQYWRAVGEYIIHLIDSKENVLRGPLSAAPRLLIT